MRKLIAIGTFVLIPIANASAQPAAPLKIVVLEGEGAVNIIQQKTAVRPLVEVRDANNLPVPAATVTFTIGSGQPAVFAGGTHTLTVTTGPTGQAAASGLNATGPGAIKIQVQAAHQGRIATTAITQTNFATAAAAAAAGVAVQAGGAAAGTTGGATAAGAGAAGAGGGGLSATTLAIVGAGVAGGAVAATQVAGSGGENGGPEVFNQYTGPLNGQIVLTSTVVSPQGGSSSCARTNRVSGTMTMRMNETAGNSAGTVQFEGALTETAISGNCLTAPAITFASSGDVRVTGGPAALTFEASPGQGMQGAGPVSRVRFNGSLTGTSVTGALAIDVGGPAPGSTTLTVTLTR